MQPSYIALTMATSSTPDTKWEEGLIPPLDLAPPQITRTIHCVCGRQIRLVVGYALPEGRENGESRQSVPIQKLWQMTTRHHQCIQDTTSRSMAEPPADTIGYATRVPPGHKWICHHCHKWMDNSEEEDQPKWHLCVRASYTTMIDANPTDLDIAPPPTTASKKQQDEEVSTTETD